MSELRNKIMNQEEKALKTGRLVKERKQKKKLNIYHILSTEEKKEAIDALIDNPSDENFGIQSHKYNTTIRNLKRWFNQGYVRKQGCGRKRVNPQAADELEKWILSETKTGRKKITRDQIKSKALGIFQSDTFKASKMWMDKFLSEHDIKYKVQIILQEQGQLSKLQEVKFKQEQSIRKEKEFESFEVKLLIKQESQEQIQTDLNNKEAFEEKVYVEDFFLDQDALNFLQDSYETQSRLNQIELYQFSEQFIPKLEFLGDNYEEIFLGQILLICQNQTYISVVYQSEITKQKIKFCLIQITQQMELRVKSNNKHLLQFCPDNRMINKQFIITLYLKN